MSHSVDESRVMIRPARNPQDYKEAAALIVAYAKWLNVDLSFQDFDNEMRSLPGKYSPPKGEILLALNSDDIVVGCVCLRALRQADCCEMKRLYVTPNGRGCGVGNELVKSIIEVAHSLGYQEMKLDSLPWMEKALALYRSHGFRPIAPYYQVPYSDGVFLGRRLR